MNWISNMYIRYLSRVFFLFHLIEKINTKEYSRFISCRKTSISLAIKGEMTDVMVYGKV